MLGRAYARPDCVEAPPEPPPSGAYLRAYPGPPRCRPPHSGYDVELTVYTFLGLPVAPISSKVCDEVLCGRSLAERE